MAQEVQLRNSSEVAKVRNPLGVIGLSIITIGIYSFFWYFYVNKEMAAFGQANGTEEAGTNPTNSLLALFPGCLALGIPTIISYFNATKRLNTVERMTVGQPGMESTPLFLLMLFLGPVGIYIFQSNLNKAWTAQGGVAPAM